MDNKEKVLIDILATVIEDEGIKNPEVKIKSISSGGANYSSVLYTITIKSPGRENLELFAKIAHMGEQMRNEVGVDYGYRTEQLVYRDLANIYDKLQKQHNIPEEEKFFFPKFYAGSDERFHETLILENLTAKGYALYDRHISVTWEYAAAAISQLAKFHALSHAFADNYPEEFDKRVIETPNLLFHGAAGLFPMFEKSQASALEVIPEDLGERLKDFFDRECTLEKYKKNYTSMRRPVFVHGDYRPSNMMHKVSDGKLDKLIPVDYQTVHCGRPVTDLLYFIFCSTDGDFRSRYYERLVDLYYCTFANFLKKLDLNPEKLYSQEEFREDLNESMPFGLFIATFGLPVILVDEEQAPVVGEDASISNFMVKPNKRFEKRYREVVNDFIRWGRL